MKKSSTITVASSHGTLTIDDTGHILSRQIDTLETESGSHLKSILRFNVTEWCGWYCKTDLPSHIDILDLGYWYMPKPDGVIWAYTPPESDWRNMMLELYGVNGARLKEIGEGKYNAKH